MQPINPQRNARLMGVAMGLLIFGLGAAGWRVWQRNQPVPLDSKRAAERVRQSLEVEKLDQIALNNYAWIDKDRGVLRLPISRAMEVSVAMYKDPAAGRSNFLARLERATTRAQNK